MKRSMIRGMRHRRDETRLARRPRRARQVGPSFEALEGRVMRAGDVNSMAMGINLPGLAYWSTSLMFVDAMKEASPTWTPSVSGVALPPMDADGYPIGLGTNTPKGYGLSTLIFNGNGENYPLGTYDLIFDGSGTVAINQGGGHLTTVSQSGRRRPAAPGEHRPEPAWHSCEHHPVRSLGLRAQHSPRHARLRRHVSDPALQPGLPGRPPVLRLSPLHGPRVRRERTRRSAAALVGLDHGRRHDPDGAGRQAPPSSTWSTWPTPCTRTCGSTCRPSPRPTTCRASRSTSRTTWTRA